MLGNFLREKRERKKKHHKRKREIRDRKNKHTYFFFLFTDACTIHFPYQYTQKKVIDNNFFHNSFAS